MSLRTVVLEKKQKILIVDKNNSRLTVDLKKRLAQYDAEIYYSSQLPSRLNSYDYCFLINERNAFRQLLSLNYQKAIVIYFNKDSEAKKTHQYKLRNTKTISLDGETFGEKEIDKLLWFALSRANESYLKIHLPKSPKPAKTDKDKVRYHPNFFSNKLIYSILIFLILIFHVLFLPFLILSSYHLYQAFVLIKNEDYINVKTNLVKSSRYLSTGKKIYSFSRPTLLLFSAALIPDNIIDVNEKAGNSINEVMSIAEDGQQIIRLAFQREKSLAEQELLVAKLNQLKKTFNKIEENINFLNQKIPERTKYLRKIKNDLVLLTDSISKLRRLLPFVDDIFAKNGERKYLLLFANNKELRPGGGFIGSFGILSIKNYTIEDLKIYDAYDADGQLIAHIEPPEAIKKYLDQPHWFFRDSAFSPDFPTNYQQALFFLDKELGLKDFNGSILLTTSAIENLLTAFDNIYLSDFNEKITAKNFYLKAQIYSEKDFFPGSIQKKSFLASLARQILINIETASLKKFFSGLNKSLDEKQMVFYFENKNIQDVIDSFYWSGRMIKPKCAANVSNCLVDFIFPVDANLGVNKANFYITRSFISKINFQQNGQVTHDFQINFVNDSPADVFPGGRYKNYFRLFLPRDIKINLLTKNDTQIDDYDEKDEENKVIGFLFDLPPKSTTNIRIVYELKNKLSKGKGVYQLIIQKQIGSSNNDLNLNLIIPKNIYLINQNFSPLVKDNKIIYNTNLSADKIFFIELIKE